MEIPPLKLPHSQNIQLLFKNLSKGDQVAARVLRRIAPFRYLISFAGQTFKVNSAIHFSPNDFALIRLTETEPRLKFKFIGNLSAANLQKPSPEILKLLGLGENGLAKLFSLFSIKFNFPMGKTHFQQFLKFENTIDKSISRSDILLPYFWVRQFTDRHNLPDWQVFLDVLFKNTKQKQKKRTFQKPGAGKQSVPTSTFPAPILRLKKLISGKQGMKDVLSEMVDDLRAGREHASGTGEKHRDDEFKSLIRYYLAIIRDFSENRWVGIPSRSLISEKNYLSFWRQCPQNPDQLDFCFQASTAQLGAVAVSGNILHQRINIQLTFEHQEMKEFAENQITSLATVLEEIDLKTGKINFEFDKEVNTLIGMMVFVENEAKIEVKI